MAHQILGLDLDGTLTNSTKEIMEILKDLHKEGRTVILITHDNDIAAQAKRVIRIKDGKVESDSGDTEAEKAAIIAERIG